MTGGEGLAMRNMFANVVRGFSLVRTTLKGRTTKGGDMPRNDNLFVTLSDSEGSERDSSVALLPQNDKNEGFRVRMTGGFPLLLCSYSIRPGRFKLTSLRIYLQS